MLRAEEKNLRKSLIQEQEAVKWAVTRRGEGGVRLTQAENEGDPGNGFKTGRRSFGGFNKAVERTEEELKEARDELKSKVDASANASDKETKPKKRQRSAEEHADVSSTEMAKTMEQFKATDAWRKRAKQEV